MFRINLILLNSNEAYQHLVSSGSTHWHSSAVLICLFVKFLRKHFMSVLCGSYLWVGVKLKERRSWLLCSPKNLSVGIEVITRRSIQRVISRKDSRAAGGHAVGIITATSPQTEFTVISIAQWRDWERASGGCEVHPFIGLQYFQHNWINSRLSKVRAWFEGLYYTWAGRNHLWMYDWCKNIFRSSCKGH